MIRTRVLALGLATLTATATLTAAPAGAASGATSQVIRVALDEIALPTGWQPEGITTDGRRTFWAGSLADGALYRGSLRTGRGEVVLPGEAGRRIVGLFHDRRSGLVWAAGAVGDEGRVWAIDGRSGHVAGIVEVPGTGFLNDLVVTRSTVWVTDSFGDQLVRIELDRHRLPDGPATLVPLPDPWPRTGDFRANGIRALPDGSLVVAHSAAGLFRYQPGKDRVAALPVTGSPGVVTGDGLELHGRTLWVVRGSGGQDVTQVRLSRRHGRWSGRVVDLLRSDRFDVPTTAGYAHGDLWVVNARFGNPAPAEADYWVTRIAVG